MFRKIILLSLILVIGLGALFPSAMRASILQPKAPLLVDLAPEVYTLALKAHRKAVANNEIDNENILSIIDYSKPSYEKRLWVIRLSDNTVLHHTYVAHGVSSGQINPTNFSNVSGSKKSSLGVFKTGEPYQGKHGLSLNLHGLEKQFNSNAYNRRVVVHGASYVGESYAKRKTLGRSHGCPAVAHFDAKPLIRDIKHGSMVFIYYPDQLWLKTSRFV